MALRDFDEKRQATPWTQVAVSVGVCYIELTCTGCGIKSYVQSRDKPLRRTGSQREFVVCPYCGVRLTVGTVVRLPRPMRERFAVWASVRVRGCRSAVHLAQQLSRLAAGASGAPGTAVPAGCPCPLPRSPSAAIPPRRFRCLSLRAVLQDAPGRRRARRRRWVARTSATGRSWLGLLAWRRSPRRLCAGAVCSYW